MIDLRGRRGHVMALVGAATCLAGFAMAAPAGAHPHGALYVSATAGPGGDGSRTAPYASLAAVEAASDPGDTIVVLPAPSSVPPLDGGIALKSRQSLIGAGPAVVGEGTAPDVAPRITNTSADHNSGDAVSLASGTEVRNLVIANSYRGAIYGTNIDRAVVAGNDISAANTSCTEGIYNYFPPPVTFSFPSGWAGIMVDNDAGASALQINGNFLHDSACSDGIDLRAFGTARVRANVDDNDITRLAQGPGFGAVQALGMQTRDDARLTVESDRNTETYIGDPAADAEGLFANQTGGELVWKLDRNTYAHGIGLQSTNGAEFHAAGQGGLLDVEITNSTFTDNPGDMIEEINDGTGGTIRVTLDHVNVSHTTHAPLSPEPTIPPLGYGALTGLGFCFSQFHTAPQGTTQLRMVDSEFSDCVSDGILAFYGNLPQYGFATGPGRLSSIDIENSKITDTGQYALHWINYGQLDALAIRARRSTFSNAHGNAVVAFDQAPGASTTDAAIDLGGGPLRNVGRNCITGGANLAAETTGYDVALQRAWWGTPSGPAPQQLSATGGTIRTDPALSAPPPGCS